MDGTATLGGGSSLIRAQLRRIFEHIQRIVQLYPKGYNQETSYLAAGPSVDHLSWYLRSLQWLLGNTLSCWSLPTTIPGATPIF